MTGTGQTVGRAGPATAVPGKRNPWPIAIVAYFVVFIAAMVTWIVYASRQQMELVGRDYYEKEILFQKQIDASDRARQAGNGVKVAYDFAQQAVTLQLSAAQPASANVSEGTIHFYRPSNARLDHNVPMSLDSAGAQTVDVKGLAPGLWKVRLSWRVNGEEYYYDQSVVVGSNS
jgi:nitrogen fixation protein FixH